MHFYCYNSIDLANKIIASDKQHEIEENITFRLYRHVYRSNNFLIDFLRLLITIIPINLNNSNRSFNKSTLIISKKTQFPKYNTIVTTTKV